MRSRRPVRWTVPEADDERLGSAGENGSGITLCVALHEAEHCEAGCVPTEQSTLPMPFALGSR